jgi:L-ornithine N5-oxygenase
MSVFDLVGVGFGPSNLALAVALQEEKSKSHSRNLRTVFLETKPKFSWHPDMLLEDMSIQVSFLKDLATLRNPCSRFTFLNYLKESERLDSFINLQEFFPTRLEINDYFLWAASHFDDQVDYKKKVTGLRPLSLNGEKAIDTIEVVCEDSVSGKIDSYLTRNLVLATGGRPNLPKGIAIKPDGIAFHSSTFLSRLRNQYSDRNFPYRFVVVGSGQSGAEILYYLANHYPNAQVSATMRGFGYRPMDDSSFINEIFFPQGVDSFYALSAVDRNEFLKNYHNINYSVVDPSLIDRIYRLLYKQKIKGVDRVKIMPFLHLESMIETTNNIEAEFTHLIDKTTVKLECDGLILATGYDHSNQHSILDGISSYLTKEQCGDYCLERNYRLISDKNFLPNIFLQGMCEKTHGFSDTLLSILSIRSKEIVDSLLSGTNISSHQNTMT